MLRSSPNDHMTRCARLGARAVPLRDVQRDPAIPPNMWRALGAVAMAVTVSALAAPLAAQTTVSNRSQATRAVLVTGASSGIGRRIAETLSRRGFFVYAGARSDADLRSLDSLPNVQSVRLDVTHEADISAAVRTITSAGRDSSAW